MVVREAHFEDHALQVLYLHPDGNHAMLEMVRHLWEYKVFVREGHPYGEHRVLRIREHHSQTRFVREEYDKKDQMGLGWKILYNQAQKVFEREVHCDGIHVDQAYLKEVAGNQVDIQGIEDTHRENLLAHRNQMGGCIGDNHKMEQCQGGYTQENQYQQDKDPAHEYQEGKQDG